MKNVFLALLLLMLSSYGAYEVYDVVEDFTWLDSDGGVPVQRSLHELIDQGKVVLLTWGYGS